MTGEITLSGKVTAIGGVREKVIAALRTGIHDVILPEENEKDLEDIPEDIRKLVRYHFVNNILDLLKITVPAKLPKLPAVDPLAPAKAKDEIYEFTLPVPAVTPQVEEPKPEEPKPLTPKEAHAKFIKELFEGQDEINRFIDSLGDVSMDEAEKKVKERFPDRKFRIADPEKSQFIDVGELFPVPDKVYHDLAGAEDSEEEKQEKPDNAQEKGIQLGPNLPPPNLTISVHSLLSHGKKAPEEKTEEPAEKAPVTAKADKPAGRPKYKAERKPLFAAPAKRQMLRGFDLIAGKKKRGKK